MTSRSNKGTPGEVCYLCCRPISKEEKRSVDHIPAKQFFPKSIRKSNSPRLVTLPVHEACNKSYELDEEYFLMSLGPLAKETFSGKVLWKDIVRKIRREKSARLAIKVRNEFKTQTDAGVYYPSGKVAKKFDPDRIYRVVWKIIRGLHFYHEEQYISENKSHLPWMFDPQQIQPDNIEQLRKMIMTQQEHGNHKGIFAYKILKSDPSGIYSYGLLFWDKIIFLCMFHLPDE